MNGIESGKLLLNTAENSKYQQQEVTIKCSASQIKRYIVDAKWWAKWCDYTNFDQNDLLLNQYGRSDPLGMSNYQSTRRFDSNQMYQKPDKIENESLLLQRNIDGNDNKQVIGTMRGLRENLFEHYDFEALQPNIWLHLYSWYSADTQIARYMKSDVLDGDSQDDQMSHK
jgi:hypothetical protein